MAVATDEQAALDAEVRSLIYDGFLTEGTAANRAGLAGKLSLAEQVVGDSLSRLAAAHMLVLQPESGEVLMANPFSAVSTAFRVESAEQGWWANCIWDALGVCAMANVDATVFTSCPDCGQAMLLEVRGSRLSSGEGLVHFAVPAAHWWDDIVFT